MPLNNDEHINNAISFISRLNEYNSSNFWWAFTFTAKNPLSSTLINNLINIFKSLYFNNQSSSNNKYSQLKFIQQKGLIEKISKTTIVIRLFINYIFHLITSIFLLIQSFTFCLLSKKRILDSEILLFSYVDGRHRDNNDSYFGDLIEIINKKRPLMKISYLFHVYRPYFKNSGNLINEKNDYNFILSYLKLSDFIFCFTQLIKVWNFKIKNSKYKIYNKKIDLKLVIKEAMINEISRGLIDNLLIYRAFLRISSQDCLKTIIYPFENKSLEKLMLIAINKKINTIGYQHSSITPRHFSLMLSNQQLKYTPLPSKIVTIGYITKEWLIKTGKFPENKIYSGVYLRNASYKYLKKDFDLTNKTKILFSFSSSYKEISQVINFLDNVEALSKMNIKFRFHPDFPYKRLDEKIKKWINNNKILISNHTVLDDLKWSDISCYVSSSLAIDSILHNVPVILIDVDHYDSDPLMRTNLPLKWTINDPKEFYVTITKILKIDIFERKKSYYKSKEFIDRYLVNKQNLDLNVFLEL